MAWSRKNNNSIILKFLFNELEVLFKFRVQKNVFFEVAAPIWTDAKHGKKGANTWEYDKYKTNLMELFYFYDVQKTTIQKICTCLKHKISFNFKKIHLL